MDGSKVDGKEIYTLKQDRQTRQTRQKDTQSVSQSVSQSDR